MKNFKFYLMVLSLFVIFASSCTSCFALSPTVSKLEGVDDNYNIVISPNTIQILGIGATVATYTNYGDRNNMYWIYENNAVLRCLVTNDADGTVVYNKTKKIDQMDIVGFLCPYYYAFFDISLIKGEYTMKITYDNQTGHPDTHLEKLSHISLHN